jgi:hypothetical protein
MTLFMDLAAAEIASKSKNVITAVKTPSGVLILIDKSALFTMDELKSGIEALATCIDVHGPTVMYRGEL